VTGNPEPEARTSKQRSPGPDDSPFSTLKGDSQEARDLGVDPDASPFRTPAIEGLPFGKDGVEARAIRRVIERVERERAAARDS
jgi:hypothetical protein